MKTQNIPTIILGNKVMGDVYPQMRDKNDVTLQALNDRLRTVIIPSGEKLYDHLNFIDV